MERTPSGNSIISDNTFEPQHNNTLTCRDEEAARMVEFHFRRLPPHGKHERILRNIIERRDPLDNNALDGIITSADSVFFDGALRGRVRWEWSSQERYMTDLIGTTALRPAVQGSGFETLIVLSEPILTHPDYDRRLLLSAFLHELVHCYLFIRCGFDAREKGGHTPGFHHIAGIIDKWAGGGYLRLCNMKANLNHFLKDRSNPVVDPRLEAFREDRHSHEGCNQSPMPERDILEDPGVMGDWR
jgi:SprT-like family